MASGGTVSATLSEWLLVALILFSLVMEFVLHRLEHWLTHRHHHLVSVVRVLYRELMVLGLVSFFFILYETISKPTGTVVLSFEFAHVFIFLLAVFYTLVVLSTMFTSLRLSARWKRMEHMDVVNYLTAKNDYAQLRATILRRHDAMWRIFWWFPNFPKLLRYMRLHEIIAFHDIRFQFIYYRNLPEHFRFSSFLRKIKSISFIQLVESHWSLYLIFLAIVLLDIARRYWTFGSDILPNDLDKASDLSEPVQADTTESIFIIVSATILAFLAQTLSVKIRRIYWELTKHPRLYYDGVDADHLEEELQKAQQNRNQRKNSTNLTNSTTPSPETDTGNDADDESILAFSVAPESELLDPMQTQPISSSRISLLPNQSTRPSSVDLAVSGPVSSPPDIWHPPMSSLRASLDRERPRNQRLPFDTQQRAATDLQPATLAQHRNNTSNPNIPDKTPFEETFVRHSLEVSRPQPVVGGTLLPSPTGARSPPKQHPPSVGASIARAAVEAARRRKAAGDPVVVSPRRRSLDAPVRSRIRSPIVSRRTSIDDVVGDRARSSVEYRRRAGGRASIELAVVMPRDELAAHLEDHRSNGQSIEQDPDSGIGGSATPRTRVRVRADADRSDREVRLDMNDGTATADDGSTAVVTETGAGEETGNVVMNPTNPTILKNLEHHRIAQNMTPARYPAWVTKLIPRLGRVASPVEKLFWFGSHQFFMWCVEFVLFFSAVLMAAASAGLSLIPLTGGSIEPLNIVTLILGILNLLFVLLKTAGIMKRYIFILHNASLIPEVVALEAIHNVRDKRVVRDDDESAASGSDTELEDADAARERRRRLGRFFRSEAEIGNVPGIEGGAAGSRPGSRTSWDAAIRRRWKRRAMTLRRRRRRRPGSGSASVAGSAIPDGDPSAVAAS